MPRLRQASLNENNMTLDEAIEQAIASVNAYLSRYQVLLLAYSGGKDSTTTVTLILWAIKEGLIKIDRSKVWIVYSDTRQELVPLHEHAIAMLKIFKSEGFNTRVVQPDLNDRFWVQMLGRGLPTPGGKFRWCVGSLKVKPVGNVTAEIYEETKSKMLVVTGMRVGESDVRDAQIVASCSKDGECGTGWWKPQTKAYDRLAPLLHWRTCQVFDWLSFETNRHGYPTRRVSIIYGDEDIRTGCNGCPVASKDFALERAIAKIPGCESLAPLLRLREWWEILRTRRDYRHRNDGTANKQAKDLGPLTMAARWEGLWFIDELQAEIYRLGGNFEIINQEERTRIFEFWQADTYPQTWNGTQPIGTSLDLIPKNQMTLFDLQPTEFEMFGN